MRSLLKNQVENVKKVRSFERAKVYEARVEKTELYSVDLRNLENTKVSTTQLMLSNLCAEQAHVHEEAEKKIEEHACYLDNQKLPI